MLPDISRSKGNQAMKFGQLIEHNIIFFLEKLCTKCGRKTIPRPFFKRIKVEHSSGSTVYFSFIF